jgi:hypothetical protein
VQNAGLASWRSEIAKAAHACQIPIAPCSNRIAKGFLAAVQRAPATELLREKGGQHATLERYSVSIQ